MPRKRDGCPACGENHPKDTVVCPITGVSLRFSDPKKAVGEVIGGKYRIESLLGRGGMGAVYAAEHIELEKKVAIKILLPESSVKARQVERFKREARSAASLGHENIVQIFDLDTSEDGSVFIVMEYLSGMDLADLIVDTKGPLSIQRTVNIACQICRGLGKAHEHGIVHRDLKPENIFLAQTENGEQVKIVDFGIAMMRQAGDANRLTAEGVLIGTPFYMSPEQARGERDLDARTDIYALGTVLFEMLTGNVPFDGDTYLEILAKHQMDTPPTLYETNPELSCPAEIEGVLRKMLEKDRALRPPLMADIDRALGRFAVDPASTTTPDGDVIEKHKDGFAETLVAFESSSSLPPSGPATPQTPVSGVGWSDAGAGVVTSELERSSRKRTMLKILGGLAVVAVLAVVAAVAIAMNAGSKDHPAVDDDPQFAINVEERPDPDDEDPPPVAIQHVEIEIDVKPIFSVITVDGEPTEGNPVILEVDKGKSVTVRVEAPDHVTMEKEIIADRNRSFSWSLEPMAVTKSVIKKVKKSDTVAPPPPPLAEGGGKKKKKVVVDKENPYLSGK